MSKAEKIDLLPCPFCGKSQEHFHRYSRKVGFDVFYCVRCYCCAETIGQTEQEAEQNWNTRQQPAKQHQGEPVAWMREDGRDAWTAEKKSDAIAHNGTPGAKIAAKYTQPLYTHADPGEVERLREEVIEWKRNTQKNSDLMMEHVEENIELKAELARLRRAPMAHQVRDYLVTAAAKQNEELATDRDIYKAEVDRLLPEIDNLRAQKAVQDALLREVKSLIDQQVYIDDSGCYDIARKINAISSSADSSTQSSLIADGKGVV